MEHMENGSVRDATIGNEPTALEIAEFEPECHLGRCSLDLQNISVGSVGSSRSYISVVLCADNNVIRADHDCANCQIRSGDLERGALGTGGNDKPLGLVVEPIVVWIGSRSNGKPVFRICIRTPSYQVNCSPVPASVVDNILGW